MKYRTPKTPPNRLANARNYYRRKKGIPEDAPHGTRAEPFNRPRRGTGNRIGRISMPPPAWKLLRKLKGRRTRGELVAAALELWDITK